MSARPRESNLEALYATNKPRNTKMAENFKIVKSDPPESKELLASAIVKISEGFDALQASGLNRDAIIVLLHDQTKLAKRDIRLILDGLKKLRGWYCR